MSNRGVIVGRLRPGAEEEVAAAFAASDATELPDLVGVVSRRLYAIGDVYIHVVDTERPFAEGVASVRDHPLFQEVSDRLRPFIEPLDPDTWRSPRDAFAREFYRWDRTDGAANAVASDGDGQVASAPPAGAAAPETPPAASPAPVAADGPAVEAPAVVIDLADVEPITARGGTIRIPVTPARAGSRHHIFGRAILEAGEEIREHVHDYGEESILVVSGRGTLIANGEAFELIPDRVAFAPRGTRHAIVNPGPEPLVLVFASAPLAPQPAAGHRETGR